MNSLALFEACLHGPWITSGRNIEFKIENSVLYLQSSREFSDWLFNFNFPVVPYKNMKEKFFVHRGFVKAWQSVRDEVMSRVDEFEVIVGYSHGADVAILAHEDFRYVRGFQPETHLYGASKILFLPSKHILSRFSQIKNHQSKGDWATKVVPFYTAVGTIHTYTKKCVRPEGMKLLDWLSNHTPAHYRQRLW